MAIYKLLLSVESPLLLDSSIPQIAPFHSGKIGSINATGILALRAKGRYNLVVGICVETGGKK